MERRLVVLVFILILLLGCSTPPKTEDVSKITIPLAIPAAYFSSVSVHEASHALTADLLGATSIKVDVVPTHGKDGTFFLGLTSSTFHKELTPLEDTFLNISGPLANLSTHVFLREFLKSNLVPELLQPTIQWASLCNDIGLYGEIVLGFARVNTTDFGKEPLWIAGTICLAAIIYDVLDILILDDPKRYFGSLLGLDFYKEEKHKKVAFSPAFGGNSKEVVFGINVFW